MPNRHAEFSFLQFTKVIVFLTDVKGSLSQLLEDAHHSLTHGPLYNMAIDHSRPSRGGRHYFQSLISRITLIGLM